MKNIFFFIYIDDDAADDDGWLEKIYTRDSYAYPNDVNRWWELSWQ